MLSAPPQWQRKERKATKLKDTQNPDIISTYISGTIRTTDWERTYRARLHLSNVILSQGRINKSAFSINEWEFRAETSPEHRYNNQLLYILNWNGTITDIWGRSRKHNATMHPKWLTINFRNPTFSAHQDILSCRKNKQIWCSVSTMIDFNLIKRPTTSGFRLPIYTPYDIENDGMSSPLATPLHVGAA